MELRTLRYFTVVARELNITRAAEKLHMSQPPLSNQMHALEEELGVTLFYRGKRRLQLTQEGELLLRRANQTNVGPQGFGGSTTALCVNIETYGTHIAGLPVAVNIGCHVTRHSSFEL